MKKFNYGNYKHIPTEVNGIKFASKLESRYYLYLLDLKEKGIVKDFELQPKYLLQDKFLIYNNETIWGSDKRFNEIKKQVKKETGHTFPHIQSIEYIADFKVYYTDGHVEIIDTKGDEKADFKLKKKMFLAKYPELNFKEMIDDSKGNWYEYKALKKKKKVKK